MDTRLAYTVAETCVALRIGRTRLYEEIRDGRLPAHKVGKRTLIRHADLEKWLAELPTVAAVRTTNGARMELARVPKSGRPSKDPGDGAKA
jgi:excisionase family DNA binding protein